MAVKTITIDMGAYELLSRHKKPGQSFSQVIKERFGADKTGKALLAGLQGIVLTERTLDEIQRQVARRRGSRARPTKL